MTATSDKVDLRAVDWPLRRRFLMAGIGYLPLLHVAAVIACAMAAGRRGWGWGLGAGVAVLYLFPPLAFRISALIFPPRRGRHAVASGVFLRWWLSAQWQVIFNRLPVLEELLRLVPGLFSMWLRLWGAKVGSLVYWSPGVVVLDRPFVHIGRRVVFGSGVRLNPHIIIPAGKRAAQLWLETITLGDDTLIGGYSLITAGATIRPGTFVPAGKYVRPFSEWRDTGAAFPVSQENPL